MVCKYTEITFASIMPMYCRKSTGHSITRSISIATLKKHFWLGLLFHITAFSSSLCGRKSGLEDQNKSYKNPEQLISLQAVSEITCKETNFPHVLGLLLLLKPLIFKLKTSAGNKRGNSFDKIKIIKTELGTRAYFLKRTSSYRAWLTSLSDNEVD